MLISLIVAASTNNVIGKDNKLLWHLPNDLKFFKNTTWAMPVVMGRKTYESMSGNPLAGRYNIVITHKADWKPGNESVHVTTNIPDAIALCRELDCKEVFIIGGGQIYEAGMSYANKIYMTRVHTVVEGDTYFPAIDEQEWKMVSHTDFPADEKHAYAYSFQVWLKQKVAGSAS